MNTALVPLTPEAPVQRDMSDMMLTSPRADILGELLHFADQSPHRVLSPPLEPAPQCAQLARGVAVWILRSYFGEEFKTCLIRICAKPFTQFGPVYLERIDSRAPTARKPRCPMAALTDHHAARTCVFSPEIDTTGQRRKLPEVEAAWILDSQLIEQLRRLHGAPGRRRKFLASSECLEDRCE